MYHYFNSIQNTRGDALIGYFVMVTDSVTGATIPIYADINSTPIISVSGLANAAQVDSDGNVSFYIDTPGQYNLNIYATDGSTLIRTIQNMAIAQGPQGATGASGLDGASGISAAGFGAKGDGVTDDYAALQSWEDNGHSIYLPAGKYRSTAKGTVRKNVLIGGSNYGFDGRQSGYANMPGAKIVYDAGVPGIDLQPQWTGTDWASLTPTQEGAMHSVVQNLGLIGSGGATATGFYGRTLFHAKNVTVEGFSGKGFDISASVASDGNSESGNASLSTLEQCHALSNTSHGFHTRGTDANVIKLDTCNASSNGGWGFLLDQEFGNALVNCHAANNTLGSYKATGGVASNVLAACYVEGDVHANCDISAPNVIIGGNLAGTAASAASNAHSGGPMPTIIDGSGYSTFGVLHINWNYWGSAPGALLSTDMGVIAGHASNGLVIQGKGATYDVSFPNQSGTIAAGVPAGSSDFRVIGFLQRADGEAILGAPGNVTTLYSIGTSGYAWKKGDNTGVIMTLSDAGALNTVGAITSSSPTAGVGYVTGAGGAVTQVTSRTTGVTLNKICGAITLVSAAGSATWNTFTVTNSAVAATDTVEISQKSGANLYNVIVTAVGAGTFNVSVSAVSGTATESPVFNFVIVKAVAA